MSAKEPLCLPYRFESSHPPLPNPSGLVRLLSPIILKLPGTVDRLRNQFPMSNAITAQFIGHDLPGFAAVASQ